MHTTIVLHGGNDLTMVLPRSWQDLPNFQDYGHDPPMWDISVQILHGGINWLHQGTGSLNQMPKNQIEIKPQMNPKCTSQPPLYRSG